MTSYKTSMLRLAMLALNVALVILLFRVIPEKKVAATFAGLTFIGTSLALFLMSYKKRQGLKTYTPWVSGGFLVLVAIPMVVVRVLNWSTEFNELSIWGIPGQQFHHLSSQLFTLQPLAVIVDAILQFVKQKKKTRSI